MRYLTPAPIECYVYNLLNNYKGDFINFRETGASFMSLVSLMSFMS